MEFICHISHWGKHLKHLGGSIEPDCSYLTVAVQSTWFDFCEATQDRKWRLSSEHPLSQRLCSQQHCTAVLFVLSLLWQTVNELKLNLNFCFHVLSFSCAFTSSAKTLSCVVRSVATSGQASLGSKGGVKISQ